MHVDLAATIGLEVKSKMIDILDGSQTIMLKIWDTAGQERFQSISRSYYQKADGIFVVFDLSKKDTFLKTQKFIDSIFNSANENVAVVLVGNKCDMQERVVTQDQGKQKASEWGGVPFFETSAKKDINVQEAFVASLKLLVSTKSGAAAGGSSKSNDEGGSGGCCIIA